MNYTTDELEKSEEMSNFHSTLAEFQKRVTSHIMSGKDDTDMKGRAKEATSFLQNLLSSSGKPCTPPNVWNPVTQQCE